MKRHDRLCDDFVTFIFFLVLFVNIGEEKSSKEKKRSLPRRRRREVFEEEDTFSPNVIDKQSKETNSDTQTANKWNSSALHCIALL